MKAVAARPEFAGLVIDACLLCERELLAVYDLMIETGRGVEGMDAAFFHVHRALLALRVKAARAAASV